MVVVVVVAVVLAAAAAAEESGAAEAAAASAAAGVLDVSCCCPYYYVLLLLLLPRQPRRPATTKATTPGRMPTTAATAIIKLLGCVRRGVSARAQFSQEISYIHAEGFPASEIRQEAVTNEFVRATRPNRHGSITLVRNFVPVICVAMRPRCCAQPDSFCIVVVQVLILLTKT